MGARKPPPACSWDDNKVSLPRRPKRKPVSTFPDWARCYSVYSHHLASHQPLRGPDCIAYLYIIATCNMEYNFSACLAYDVSFRKQADRFKLTTWGQIDPQLYARAFTGAGKACPHAWCEHCLSPTHSSTDCTLFYPKGPAKRARLTSAGPKPFTTPFQEICRKSNHGGCTRDNCPRQHTCLSPRHEPNLLRKLPIFLSSSSEIRFLFFFLMLPIFLVLCDTCAFPLVANWPKSFISQRVPSALDILVDPE